MKWTSIDDNNEMDNDDDDEMQNDDNASYEGWFSSKKAYFCTFTNKASDANVEAHGNEGTHLGSGTSEAVDYYRGQLDSVMREDLQNLLAGISLMNQ